jgi:AcrR family transcriptional regulator
MPRPHIPDEHLLESARAVFLRDGPDATSTAVAEAAGVSVALLFKRFGTKQALFERAMAWQEQPWMIELRPLRGRGDLRDNLERVALAMIESFRTEMPKHMMVWASSPAEAWGAGEPPPVRGMKVVAAWFEEEMRLGRMRRSDPEVAARVFSGAIVAFAMAEMTGLAERMPLATTTFVRGLADAFWLGARPDPADGGTL